MFEHTSRYYNLKTTTYTTPGGRQIQYVLRRFLPRPEDLPLLYYVQVQQDDRLDLITARVLGAPEAFWRICDANRAFHPLDLAEKPGQKIRITTPQI